MFFMVHYVRTLLTPVPPAVGDAVSQWCCCAAQGLRLMSRGSMWWISGSIVWVAVTIPLSIIVLTCNVDDNSASCDNPSTALFILQAFATFTFTIVWTFFGVQFFLYQKGSTAEDSHSQYLQMQLDTASGERRSDFFAFFGIGVLGLVLCAEYVIMAQTDSTIF